MKKSLLIGSALLLTTAVMGVAVASSEFPLLGHPGHERRSALADGDGRSVQLAHRGEREHHAGRHHERRRHDDDHGEGGGRGSLSQTGPADPNAPVPDNGVFNNKARPQVEVT